MRHTQKPKLELKFKVNYDVISSLDSKNNDGENQI